MGFRRDGPSSVLEKRVIFLSESEIIDYARYGITSIDMDQVNADGKERGIRDFEGHLSADLYSINLNPLGTISQVAAIWVKYYDRAPKIFIASKRLDKSEKTNIPKDAIRVESDKGPVSVDFMIHTTHPTLWYDRPVELRPIYKA